MAHYWPNENSKWSTLEDLLLYFGVTWFSPLLKYCMIGPSLLTVAQLVRNFWASLALNKNSYLKPCKYCITMYIYISHLTLSWNTWSITTDNHMYSCMLPYYIWSNFLWYGRQLFTVITYIHEPHDESS